MKEENEVFELCKQVYEATGWKYTIGKFHDDGSYDGYVRHGGVAYTPNPQDAEWLPKNIPLYTSDYLLEKLPKHLESQEKLNVTYFDKVPGTGEICWRAEYTHLFADGTWDIRWEYQGNGDTPLKALLKLTLKLHEEGLL